MIPLLDLKAQHAQIGHEVEEAALRVLRSGHYVLGQEVQAFEDAFAAYCGTRHAVATNTGTSALHLALIAAGIGPGDEVITTPFTFVATVAAILYAGARPVLVDIEPDTMTIDPARVAEAITRNTRAIMPVHLYGQVADMDPLLAIAETHDLAVIEDACQAHGAEYHGRRAGSMGLAGAFSFYPGKNLGACGEGGILVTDNDAVARAARRLRDWGQEARYHHTAKGFNYRMDAIQGAILAVKLRHLEEWTTRRREHARRYAGLLGDPPGLRLPSEANGRRHVYHVYALRSRERDQLRETLLNEGIQTGLHYPIPVHMQPAYADLSYRQGDFPHAEQAAREVLSLPIYPEMDSTDIDKVASAIGREVHVG